MPPETEQAAPPADIQTPPPDSGATEQSKQTHQLLQLLVDNGSVEPLPKPGEKEDNDDDGAVKAPRREAKPEPKAGEPEKKPNAARPPEQKPPESDIPLRVRGKKLERPPLPIPQRQPAEPAAPAEAPKPDPRWEASLHKTERDMLAEAMDVENLFPDKHKGLAARTEAFVRAHQKYVEEAGDDFDDQSPEYLAWMEKNQPKLESSEIREVETARISNRVKADWEPKVQSLEHQLFVRDEEPKVAQEGTNIYVALEQAAVPKEVLDAIKKDGFAKASEVFALEIETTQAVLTGATEDFKEFMRLGRTNKATGKTMVDEVVDPSDPKFEQHERLRSMVRTVCDDFMQRAPVTEQMRNGRWFVTREEYSQLPAAERPKYWTFSNEDIIQRAQPMIKHALEQAIKTKREYFEKRGFKRQPVAQAPAPERKPPTPTPRIPAGGPVASPPNADPGAQPSLGKQLAAKLSQQ